MNDSSNSNIDQDLNAPIELDVVRITHINGEKLEKPCLARVFLRLSPSLMPLIESKSFPRDIFDPRFKSPFVISIDGKRDVVVLVASFDMNTVTLTTAAGTLAPRKSPVTVIHPDRKIYKIYFGVLNFPEFFGPMDKWIEKQGQCHRLGMAELVHENQKICITAAVNLSEQEKELRKKGGFALTHTGWVEHADDSIFGEDEADDVLHRLTSFLSFAQGKACGLARVNAVCEDGKQTSYQWGTRFTDRWEQRSDNWWPRVSGGAESLSETFSGFSELCSDPSWNDVILRVIQMYIFSNTTRIDTGLILTHSALELLCKKLGCVQAPRESMGDYLSRSIQTFLPEITENSLAQNLVLHRRDGRAMKFLGPKAISKLRNDLIHTEREYQDNGDIQMEALRLGLWYIELILLKLFGYQGTYINRLKARGEEAYESVPWAMPNSPGSSAG